MCMRQIVSFDIFIICDAKSKGSGETAYTHMLQACVKQKKLLLSNLPEIFAKTHDSVIACTRVTGA